jgi:hypothetical protein
MWIGSHARPLHASTDAHITGRVYLDGQVLVNKDELEIEDGLREFVPDYGDPFTAVYWFVRSTLIGVTCFHAATPLHVLVIHQKTVTHATNAEDHVPFEVVANPDLEFVGR